MKTALFIIPIAVMVTALAGGIFLYASANSEPAVEEPETAADSAENARQAELDRQESLRQEQQENSIEALVRESLGETNRLTANSIVDVESVIPNGNGTFVVTSLVKDGLAVSGSVEDGYTMTPVNFKKYTTTIEKGLVVSTTSEDIKESYTYSIPEYGKDSVSVALKDPSFGNFAEANKGTNFMIYTLNAAGVGNPDCPKDGCVLVWAQNFDTKESTRALVNQETGKVVLVESTGDKR